MLLPAMIGGLGLMRRRARRRVEQCTASSPREAGRNAVGNSAARLARRIGPPLMLLMCSPMLTGCATVLHGTTQSIPVNSNPCGARVLVDGTHEFSTPCHVKMQRNRDHHVIIEMPGYERAEYQITRQPTGKAVNNIWVGGLIGLGVDAATGADNKLVPESIYVDLRRLTANTYGPGTPDRFAAVNELRRDAGGY